MTTIIGKQAALDALDHFDIRVARTKEVDSAEDAIAFAERRNAKDPRIVPIVLRPNGDKLDSEAAIRQAYDDLVRAAGTGERHIFAQTYTAPGTDVTIVGELDEALGKTLALHGTTNGGVRRMVPLDAAGAEALVLSFLGFDHHGPREQTRRMLEHLLMKVSAMYEETPLLSFRIDVRLHENGYTVIDAAMAASKALHLRKRLDRRAHDRKGDEFHPAGVQ